MVLDLNASFYSTCVPNPNVPNPNPNPKCTNPEDGEICICSIHFPVDVSAYILFSPFTFTQGA